MSGPSYDEEGGGGALFTEINVTPLTDIFLVLLIIFMVTASGLSTASMDVALPKAAVPGEVDASSVVTVAIDARGRYFVDKDEVPGDRLEASLRRALASSKESAVVLAGDRSVPLERTVELMEAARRAGAKRFAIAVAREERAATVARSEGR